MAKVGEHEFCSAELSNLTYPVACQPKWQVSTIIFQNNDLPLAMLSVELDGRLNTESKLDSRVTAIITCLHSPDIHRNARN